MSDPTIQNLNPFILPQSPLYQAAVKLAAKKALELEKEKAKKADPPLFFNVAQINALLNRFGAKRWTFEQIRNFPMALLNPNERQFIRYLQRHPQIFRQLASLDRHPETLSLQDIKIAAQLAGDALVLSSEDLQFLKELPESVTSAPRSANAEPLPHPDADEIFHFLQKVAPNGLRFSEVQNLPLPPDHTPREAQIRELLQARSVQKVLYNLTLSTQGLVTLDVLRILLSLIWNPAILGTAPIVFMKSPELERDDEEDVPNVDGVPEVETEEQGTSGRLRLRAKIQWHADQLKKLLHRISPDTDHVTLMQFRDYQPANEEEREMVSLLRQTSVFRALAGQDRDFKDLSVEDIELALIERTLILSDPYITLVILP